MFERVKHFLCHICSSEAQLVNKVSAFLLYKISLPLSTTHRGYKSINVSNQIGRSEIVFESLAGESMLVVCAVTACGLAGKYRSFGGFSIEVLKMFFRNVGISLQAT
jgi:hypothetical protein